MDKTLIALTSALGCKLIDLKNCKWYEFRKKRKIKKRINELYKKSINSPQQ